MPEQTKGFGYPKESLNMNRLSFSLDYGTSFDYGTKCLSAALYLSIPHAAADSMRALSLMTVS